VSKVIDRRRGLVRIFDRLEGVRAAVGLGARLDPDELIRRATRKVGTSDLGEGPVREALTVLTKSFESDAELSPLGVRVVRDTLCRFLVERLEILQAIERDPAIRDERIERPIFVVGPPRTGTTLLLNLLATLPDVRPLLSYEAYHPVPSGSPGADGDPRIKLHERNIRALLWLIPDLPLIHEVNPTGPEECVPLLLRTFVSGAWRLYGHLPTYEAWVAERPREDIETGYRFHADQLRLLQRQRGGGRWLLKSPVHLDGFETLLRAYPDAVFVRTHRDLRKVLPSACSLMEAARRNTAPRFDPGRLGASALAVAERAFERVVPPIPEADRKRVLDIRYADLVADPVGTVSQILQAIGVSSSSEIEAAVNAWMAANPKGKQGVHRYDMTTFGIDEADIEALASRYSERFGVPRE